MSQSLEEICIQKHGEAQLQARLYVPVVLCHRIVKKSSAPGLWRCVGGNERNDTGRWRRWRRSASYVVVAVAAAVTVMKRAIIAASITAVVAVVVSHPWTQKNGTGTILSCTVGGKMVGLHSTFMFSGLHTTFNFVANSLIDFLLLLFDFYLGFYFKILFSGLLRSPGQGHAPHLLNGLD